MKLQKQVSRKINGKKYYKWVLVIPPKIIKEMYFSEATPLKITSMENNKLIIEPLGMDLERHFGRNQGVLLKRLFDFLNKYKDSEKGFTATELHDTINRQNFCNKVLNAFSEKHNYVFLKKKIERACGLKVFWNRIGHQKRYYVRKTSKATPELHRDVNDPRFVKGEDETEYFTGHDKQTLSALKDESYD